MDPLILSSQSKFRATDPKNIYPNEKKDLLIQKGIFITLVLSETIYFIFIVKCIVRLKQTREWKFLFPLVAALFAFMNNLNDIIYVILAPTLGTTNCNGVFKVVFVITATFNWTPISFLQFLRLFQLTRGYYTPYWHYMISIGSFTLSVIYCICYYYNLFGFYGTKSRFLGCAMYNIRVGYLVEVSDTLDSGFSLFIIIASIRKALLNLKQYKLRHQKLKALKDESVFVFIILTASKICIYSVILYFRNMPGGDIFWDTLSVIVIACSYRIVNFKPKLNEKLENTRKILNNKNINYMNMKNMKNINIKVQNNSNTNDLTNGNYNKFQFRNNEDTNEHGSSSHFSKNFELYNRNSQGELNFPSLMKREDPYGYLNPNSNQIPNQNHYLPKTYHGNSNGFPQVTTTTTTNNTTNSAFIHSNNNINDVYTQDQGQASNYLYLRGEDRDVSDIGFGDGGYSGYSGHSGHSGHPVAGIAIPSYSYDNRSYSGSGRSSNARGGGGGGKVLTAGINMNNLNFNSMSRNNMKYTDRSSPPDKFGGSSDHSKKYSAYSNTTTTTSNHYSNKSNSNSNHDHYYY